MFERYTEQARRSIFFARYEASSFGSPYIDTEHLLLGLVREDKSFAGSAPAHRIREQVEQRIPRRNRVSTSVDLPLSEQVKAALAYASEEADQFHHKNIDCGHLLLGLLRMENCVAAELLRQNGIDYETFRNQVPQAPMPRDPESAAILLEMPVQKAIAASLDSVVNNLHGLISKAAEHLSELSESDSDKPVANKSWSRKEALGHLVDWSTTHHHWFACALAGPKLVAPEYPQEDWVRSQYYASLFWRDLVRLWLSVNQLLIHVLAHVPEEKLNTPCRIGINDPIPLSKLIAGYLEHTQDILTQILTRG